MSTSVSSTPSGAPRVAQLLRDAAAELLASGSESPRLDAELLLGHVLGVGRATLLAGPEASVGADHAATFGQLVQRRRKGEPVSYIRGLKEFYGLALSVDRRALIPRPETERLVELALERIGRALSAAPRGPDAPPLLVWDVGTGSGAVAVAVAVECRRRGYLPELNLLATDSSADALALALENAVAHGVADAIRFAPGDLTELAGAADAPPATILLANLPYIPTEEVARLPVAASFEPVGSLDGGPDGLAVIGRLVEQLPSALGPGGLALLEMGADQGPGIEQLAHAFLRDWPLSIHDDLAGRPRVAELARPQG